MAERAASKFELTPLRVAMIYLIVANAWIVGSALILHLMFGHASWTVTQSVELGKGVLFVLVTAGLLHGLMWAMTRQIRRERDVAAGLEARYRAIFEANPEPTFLFRMPGLEIIAVNPAAERRYGWTCEEFTSMTLRDIRPAHEVEHMERHFSQHPEGNLQNFSFIHQTSGGEMFPVRVRSAHVIIDGESARLAVAIDLSEIVKVREQLQVANDELRNLNVSLESRIADRTTSLRRAVSELEWFGESLSHDLQQPIAHIRTLATHLAITSHERLTPHESEMVHRIIGATARVGHHIQELLDFARAEGEGHGEPLSLVLIVSECVGQLAREMGGEPNLSVREPLHWVQAHRPTLSRVITSLLRLGLRPGMDPSGSRLVVYADRVGDRVRLRFESGTDAYAEAGAYLSNTQRPREPSGFTAAMTMIIRSVAKMNGQISFESQTPDRVTLTLDLPSAKEA